MAKTETVTLRVNPDLKREAEALCADMGLTLSTAYTMLLKAIVHTRSIPFPIRAANNPSVTHSTSNPMLSALAKASNALAGTAAEAGFQNEADMQRYAKEVVRPEVWEEWNSARDA